MAAEGAEPRIAAVVPTIDPTNLQHAIPWLQLLQGLGVVPVVAANSARTAAIELPAGFVRSTDGTNGGFARSVNRGAADAGDWDWLLVLNDDLQPTAEAVAAIVEAVRTAEGTGPRLLLFDPEDPRTIPSRSETLIGLSLIGEIPARLQRGGSHHGVPFAGPLPAGRFKSFSAVAIDRAAWQQVGTLSEQFLFCYEDAEYARRFLQAGGTAIAAPVQIQHNRSKSTKSRIRMVLPAIAGSATAYLRSSGVPGPVARALVVVALALRVPMVFGASAPWGEHLAGIATGIRLAVSDRPASLPPFSDGRTRSTTSGGR